MPSNRDLYNEEVIHAHREALATLRELLANEKDPLKRYKFANAILRARPLKDPSPSSPAKGEKGEQEKVSRLCKPGKSALPATPHQIATAVNQAHFNPDPDIDIDAGAHSLEASFDRQIDKLSHQLLHGPDQLTALNKLQAIMRGDMSPLTSSTNTAEGS